MRQERGSEDRILRILVSLGSTNLGFLIGIRGGEVGEIDGDRISAPVDSLVGVEGEEDGLEAGKGLVVSAAGAAREVEAGDGGEETEDGEVEGGVSGLEGVVEPATEVVVAGAGIGTTEAAGDGGGDDVVVEEVECGV